MEKKNFCSAKWEIFDFVVVVVVVVVVEDLVEGFGFVDRREIFGSVDLLEIFDLEIFDLEIFDLKIFDLKIFDLEIFDLEIFDLEMESHSHEEFDMILKVGNEFDVMKEKLIGNVFVLLFLFHRFDRILIGMVGMFGCGNLDLGKSDNFYRFGFG